MKYVVYNNAGAIDKIDAPEGYTIADYIEDCRINGEEPENPEELYLVAEDN